MRSRSRDGSPRIPDSQSCDVELVRTPSHTSEQGFVDEEREDEEGEFNSNRPGSPAGGSKPDGMKKAMSLDPLLPSASTPLTRDHGTTSLSRTQSTVESGVRSRRRSSTSRRFTASSPQIPTGFTVPAGPSGASQTFFSAEEDVIEEQTDSDEETPSEEDPPDNSAYPQVRASVPATDDASLSISTPRMWILSLVFALLGSATNLLFSLRYPSVAITPVIALILAHPLGLAWDTLLKRADDPIVEFADGFRIATADTSPETTSSRDGILHRFRLWLAQGRWNTKEHACVYVSSNVAFGFAFATDVIVEQKMFYHQEPAIAYQLLLTISTQILGYAFAGATRRYLVRPPSMIWPATLMSCAMFTTFHRSENKPANGWRISRWRFFVLVWTGSFLWYFMPGLLMPALSYFNALTWFAPDSVVLANLFGVSSGLGLFPLTFDWAQLAYIGSPLLTPWWAAANVVGGLAVIMWFIAPIMYYTNSLYSAFMPILSSSVFDNTGSIYDVSKILTKDFLFDEEAFKSYSPIYLPITYVLSYGVQFASLTALASHTICWHGRDIWQQTKESFAERRSEKRSAEYQPLGQEQDRPRSSGSIGGIDPAARERAPGFEFSMSGEDVHNRLMARYTDVPILWYLLMFVAMLAIGIFLVEYYPVHLPWYGLLLALGITTVMFLPVAIIMAITNQHSSLYLIAQLVCGTIFPGRPVANMVFTTYAYISSTQGIKFAADLKLGHYMKIPPRILFAVQVAATVASSLTQVSVLNWMFRHVRGLCTPGAINGFICPIARVHFNGSILWGVVGPARFFGPGTLYRPLIWAFLIGLVVPVGGWMVARRRGEDSWLRRLHFPLLLGSIAWIPPATGLNFSGWALICFAFNGVVRRRAAAWWGKYNMTLSAALDSGLAFGLVVAFFGFIYPGFMDGFSWWGTEVFKQGCDWKACPLQTVPEGSHFGPDRW